MVLVLHPAAGQRERLSLVRDVSVEQDQGLVGQTDPGLVAVVFGKLGPKHFGDRTVRELHAHLST